MALIDRRRIRTASAARRRRSSAKGSAVRYMHGLQAMFSATSVFSADTALQRR